MADEPDVDQLSPEEKKTADTILRDILGPNLELELPKNVLERHRSLARRLGLPVEVVTR